MIIGLDMICNYPPVIKRGNGKSPINGGLNGYYKGDFPLQCLITGVSVCIKNPRFEASLVDFLGFFI